ncbi:MAG TPA: hypothetical protein VGH28_16590 [Polyangiaceae bacterium]|jgi:hypothetical protein
MGRLAYVGFALTIMASTACSAGAPPFMQDGDGGIIVERSDAEVAEACDQPAEGCPCTDVGTKAYCGMTYRVSGDHVDCSPGYFTCGDDGRWGACIGPSIYDGH